MNFGHWISEAAKNNPDPLNPSSTAKQSAIVKILKHPNIARIDNVLSGKSGSGATPIDIANLGPAAAADPRARAFGRSAGLAAITVGAGIGAGALGAPTSAGTVGAAGAEGAAAADAGVPEQLSGPVDQASVDTAGLGGTTPEQLSGPLTDSSSATDASFGGVGDTFVPPSDIAGGEFPASTGGFETPSGEAQGGGTTPGFEGPQTQPTDWADIGAKALKYTPLALGGVSAIAQRQAYSRAAAHINAIAGPQRDLGNQLIAQFNSGTLNAADQASIDKFQATATAQSRQYFANSGQSNSTAALQSERDIGAQANAMKAQALQNMLVQGTTLLNIADRYQLAAVQAELRGDTALMSMAGSFMGSYGKWLAMGD